MGRKTIRYLRAAGGQGTLRPRYLSAAQLRRGAGLPVRGGGFAVAPLTLFFSAACVLAAATVLGVWSGLVGPGATSPTLVAQR